MNEVNYDKMSLLELREVARVQEHELRSCRTTKFKDEFARRLGLELMRELRTKPLMEWPEAQCKIYAEVTALHPVGSRVWREEV